MSEGDWHAGHALAIGLGLVGDQIETTGDRGERVVGDTLALLLNAHHEPVSFRLGARRRDVQWNCLHDTADSANEGRKYAHMEPYPLRARSLAVLRAELPPS
jgi:glycogen operon protein